jgi:hypothetical protein
VLNRDSRDKTCKIFNDVETKDLCTMRYSSTSNKALLFTSQNIFIIAIINILFFHKLPRNITLGPHELNNTVFAFHNIEFNSLRNIFTLLWEDFILLDGNG